MEQTTRWRRSLYRTCPAAQETEAPTQRAAGGVEGRTAGPSPSGAARMAPRWVTPWVWVALGLLVGGLPAVAGPVPSMPLGVQPLPIDGNHRCDPVGDEQRFRTTDTSGRTIIDYGRHGTVCLNEGRYSEAIPYLERIALEANVEGLVALGCAYDGAGRFRDAAARWQQARRLYRAIRSQRSGWNPPPDFFNHPLGLESALFARHYAAALAMLKQEFSPHEVQGAYACCPPGHPVTAPYNVATFDDLGLTQPLVNALTVAAQGNPRHGAELISPLYSIEAGFGELRYPRAIMLLAIGRRDEARVELRLAARFTTPSSHYDGPYPYQWSALAILERLAKGAR